MQIKSEWLLVRILHRETLSQKYWVKALKSYRKALKQKHWFARIIRFNAVFAPKIIIIIIIIIIIVIDL